ncbi:pilus assembly protein TadG-related protein [Oceanobacillus saliphilus]|uniref:pilus assembly protein TadG-related protein n=1 Tax=Oceanobacillus saliphilus TaxID=2925834 RepID=UPI00201DF5E0|nr:Tad domain-containing protein [Oceanobacillus saliphilus]
MRKRKAIVRDQDGVAMILVALCLFIFVGFTAIVVDAGGLYFEKSRLQKALDAAVLGGAQVLTISEAKAEEVAVELATKNDFPVSLDEVETGSTFIQIHKTVNKDLTFARVLGFNDAAVAATARAEIMNSLDSGDDIVPIGIEQGACIEGEEAEEEEDCERWEYVAGESYTMHFQPGKNSVKGNFGFLDVESNGKNLRDDIENGVTLHTDEVLTKTGFSWGQVSKGFDDRVKADKDKDHCQPNEDGSVTADNSCSRVITVPIIETYEEVEGKSTVKIIGFAAFYVEKVIDDGNDRRIIGKFIDFVRGGEFAEGGKDFGISGVKLVN